MERPLLGIFAGKTDIFVKIETFDFRWIECTRVGSLGKILVETRRCITGGQTKDIGSLVSECLLYIINNDTGGDLAHMIEIRCYDNFKWHYGISLPAHVRFRFEVSRSSIVAF